MTTRVDRIGVDAGAPADAAALAATVRETGAAMVRVRFALAGWAEPDEAFIAAARSAVAAIRAAGLQVLGVIDSDLTVAPQGMGAFADGPQGALAVAWANEMGEHAARLASGLADLVEAWEILPEPNRGAAPRIAPARWAALVADIAARVRQAAPGAAIVSGGLVSDDADDAVDYLSAAMRAAADGRLWPAGAPPIDALGIRLGVLADGGTSGDHVAAIVAERARRLWRVMEQFEGTAAAEARGVYVTGIGWDADRVGEDVQARNVWAALNALTSDPTVHMVIWDGIIDAAGSAGGAVGLFRGTSTAPSDRRWAWNAFTDFAAYARQITPAAGVEGLLAGLDTAPAPAAVAGPEAAAAAAGEPDTVKPAAVDLDGGRAEAGEPPWSEPAALEPEAADAEIAAPSWGAPGAAEPGAVEPADVDATAHVEPPSSVPPAEPAPPAEPLPEAPTAAVPEFFEPAWPGPDDGAPPADRPAWPSLEAAAAMADLEAVEPQVPDLDTAAGWGEGDASAQGAAEPADVAPSMVPAVWAEPAVAEPDMVEPAMLEPAVDEPAMLAPEIAEPSMAEPSVAEPSVAEPAAVEPAAIEAVPVEPVYPAIPSIDAETVEPAPIEVAAEAVETAVAVEPWARAGAAPAPDTAAATAVEAEVVDFRIPDAVEVLRAAGFDGARLAAVLDAVRQKYGDPAWLPAGDYHVTVRPPAAAPAVPMTYTNQQIISALYRAGGGTWDVFERSGLKLGDMAARRTQAYAGPAVADMTDLSADERDLVARELEAIVAAVR